MNILDTILAAKRTELAHAQQATPQAELERKAATRPTPRGFAQSLAIKGVRIIAEIKRASPSRGDILPDLDPAAIARAYTTGGAAALSVLTEPAFFKGSALDLQQARSATDLPVLRKDFIISPYQVYESAALGADALLLIVRILDDDTLHTLYTLATQLGMDVLCEVFDEQDVHRANALGAPLVGINNRDLACFKTDVTHAIHLAHALNPNTQVVALSGLRTVADLQQNLAGGIRRFLIGETLMRESNPASTLRAWIALSSARPTCPPHPPARETLS